MEIAMAASASPAVQNDDDVTIVTSSKNKKGTLELLKEFNFPLNDKKN